MRKFWTIIAFGILFLEMSAQDSIPPTTFDRGLSFKTLFMDYQSLNGGSFSAFKNLNYGFEVGYHKQLQPKLQLVIPIKLGSVRSHVDSIRSINKVVGSIDAQLQYALSKPDAQIKPYVMAGAGGVMEFEGDFNAQFPLGLGVNFRAANNLDINIQAEYRHALKENRSNFQYGIGFVYRYGQKDKEDTPKEDKKDDELMDNDGDGIPNNLDLCPDQFGPKIFNGCPDTDGDGVPDYQDECPNVAGPRLLKGCPDTDGDGVADIHDECPNVAGTATNKGCPEEKKDQTPAPAPTDPDDDGDGVPNAQDKCPNEKGIAQFGGCPDTDGDGIPDKDDLCPKKPGPRVYGGCPDTDGDGIPDNEDKCPNTPGPVSNKGCPEIAKEDKKTLDVAMRSVQFETGKATFKQESYAILRQIANIIDRYPDFSVVIGGHTDNTGSSSANQALSERRAKACYDYLIQLGIPAGRLTYAGYGDSRPIADNNTLNGRSLNRRVEFKMVPNE